MFGKRKQSGTPPVRKRNRPVASNEPRKVFSYYANRSPSETKRDRAKDGVAAIKIRRPIQRQKILALAGFIMAAGLIGFSLFLGAPKVVLTGSPAERVSLREPAVYVSAAEKMFNDSITNKTKLTFNQAAFKKQFLAEFPEVANVRIALPLVGKQPIVYVDPSPGTLIFVDKSGASFVVNDQGDVISKNKADGAQNIATVHDSASVNPTIGTRVLPSTEVAFILAVEQQLGRNNIAVSSFTLPPEPQRLQAHLEDKTYTVVFTFSNDAKQQIGAYLATQKRLDEKHIMPTEYIDVRVGERVYYK